MGKAVCGVAMAAAPTADGLREIRIALAGVADRPVLTTCAARLVERGGWPDLAHLRAAIGMEIEVTSDTSIDADLRLQFAGVLVHRCVKELMNECDH
ncbi:hypothetical protein AC629_24170 [Bradyrhizobium sp. NAS80.1]|uniref:hypothetical protein n=1 Tax=Bradyrhizobium sp. NAS80.1 TaxID=1680159 RepID=UPI0009697876|nr:hypothetical protein [Bradyrhizobium sp. NAS80.1]OKO82283.1 hypothetical protein AC629_24170 [Bradyrhizobium sp. NAS80.1]